MPCIFIYDLSICLVYQHCLIFRTFVHFLQFSDIQLKLSRCLELRQDLGTSNARGRQLHRTCVPNLWVLLGEPPNQHRPETVVTSAQKMVYVIESKHETHSK